MRLATCGLLGLLLAGCGGGPSTGGDGGAREGGPPREAGLPEASVPEAGCWGCDVPDGAFVFHPDAGSCPAEPEAGAACGCVGPFLRCDTGCECGADRADGGTCIEQLGICVPLQWRHREGRGAVWNWCGRTHACADGSPCAIDEQLAERPPMPIEGACVPLEYCRALDEADPPLPAQRCYWSDGREAVAPPPAEGRCPEPIWPGIPFCGGVCGREPCPWGPGQECVGVSDQRPFGVCGSPITSGVYPDHGRCERGRRGWNLQVLRDCAGQGGVPCGCLIFESSFPGQEPWSRGAPVPLRACEAYAAMFPETTRCVDADWEPYL